MWTLQVQTSWFARVQWTLAAAAVLLAGGFYALGYRPITARLHELRTQIDQHQHDLASGQTQTSILPNVTSQVNLLRLKLDKFKALPRQQELPQFIRDIAQLGQQATLRKFDLKPGVPSRDDRFNELPIQLTFEGDFVSVFS